MKGFQTLTAPTFCQCSTSNIHRHTHSPCTRCRCSACKSLHTPDTPACCSVRSLKNTQNKTGLHRRRSGCCSHMPPMCDTNCHRPSTGPSSADSLFLPRYTSARRGAWGTCHPLWCNRLGTSFLLLADSCHTQSRRRPARRSSTPSFPDRRYIGSTAQSCSACSCSTARLSPATACTLPRIGAPHLLC